jgi:hypothetical protein
MEIPTTTGDQPVSQEKKKPRQFDFSMSVSWHTIGYMHDIA